MLQEFLLSLKFSRGHSHRVALGRFGESFLCYKNVFFRYSFGRCEVEACTKGCSQLRINDGTFSFGRCFVFSFPTVCAVSLIILFVSMEFS